MANTTSLQERLRTLEAALDVAVETRDTNFPTNPPIDLLVQITNLEQRIARLKEQIDAAKSGAEVPLTNADDDYALLLQFFVTLKHLQKMLAQHEDFINQVRPILIPPIRQRVANYTSISITVVIVFFWVSFLAWRLQDVQTYLSLHPVIGAVMTISLAGLAFLIWWLPSQGGVE